MKTALRERITGTTNGSTAVDLSIPQIRPGQSGYVTHVALANSSGESVDVQFGITSSGAFDQILAKDTVADGNAVGHRLSLPLLEGDKLTARVTGSAKSAKVLLIVAGELNDHRPEVVTVIQTIDRSGASA